MIPDLSAPVGFAYAWKRIALYGETDTANIQKMAKDGWVSVPKERHPNVESSDPDSIVIGGLILVERSIEIENEARKALTKAADDAYNFYAARLEAALRSVDPDFRAPRSVNGVITYTSVKDQLAN